MTQAMAIHLMTQMLTNAGELAVPVVGAAFVAGFVLSILQATTQINDPAVSFVPKLAAVVFALLMFGGAVLSLAVSYTHNLWQALPAMVR